MATTDATPASHDLPSHDDMIQLARKITSLPLERSIQEYSTIRQEMDWDIVALRQQLSHTSYADSGLKHSLAALMLEKCLLFTNNDLLDECISIFRDLLLSARNDSRDGTAEYAEYLDGLGEALATRYHEYTSYNDAAESISLHEQSLQLRALLGLDQSRSLRGYGVALHRSHKTEASPDHSIACAHLERAVSSTTLDSLLQRPRSLAHLANILNSMKDGNPDHGRALSVCCDALALAPPGHVEHAHVSVVATSLLVAIARRTGGLSPECEQATLYACELTASMAHPFRFQALCTHSSTVANLCVQSGAHAGLLSIADRLREALEGCSPLNIDWIYMGTCTTYAQIIGYHLSSQQDYLDDAIMSGRLLQSRFGLVKARDGKNWASTLHNLSIALSTRFELTGREEDLDEALKYCDQLVGSDALKREPSVMHTAGSLHMFRFRLSEDDSDLDNAASYFSLCIPMLPEIEVSRAVSCAIGYASTSELRFKRQKDPTIMYETVAVLRSTLERRPPKIRKHKLLHSLATCLRLLAGHTSDPTSAIEAISLEQEAITLLPSENTDLAEYLGGIGISHLVLWKTGGDIVDQHTAVKYFRDSQDRYGTSHYRQYLSCIEWYETASSLHDPELVSLSQHRALSLLPRVILFGKNLQPRLRLIKQAPTLARDAALRMLSQSNSDARTALEILEQGRGVFWSRALSSRAPLDGLPVELAKRLKDVYQLLENDNLEQGDGLSRRRALTLELDELLQSAKETRGYEHLQGSRPFSELVTAACNGHIVVLVPGNDSSVALIIRHSSTNCHKVALPLVTLEMLRKVSLGIEAKNRYERGCLPEDDGARKLVKTKRTLIERDYSNMLGEVWTKMMQPIIVALDLQVPKDASSRPRIWWCPTGPFAFIPLHAAGIYDGVNPKCVSDYAVSSYTPTLTALVNAYRARPTTTPSSPNMHCLLVGVSDAENYSPLPNAAKEIKILQEIVSHSCIVSARHDETVSGLLKHISESSIVHFACHGRQFQDDPLKSGFVLHSGILEISALMELNVPHGAFSFLSACESAMGDKKLSDEAVHLAAAMMFVGFRSVVGTMWSMNDADGPTVAEHVYKELLAKSVNEFNYDAIPRALDAAIRRLRGDGVHPSRWATWIHMGI